MRLSILNWFINSELGIKPGRLIKAPLRIIFWLVDLIKFSSIIPKKYKLTFMPSIHDKFEESGSINNEYFWQDLLCSQYLFKNRAKIVAAHYDIGSRIDGFVSSVAAYTECVVFDIRPQTSTYKNIDFQQLDLTGTLSEKYIGLADTLSCLHTLEHIGLGRYGDTLSADSWKVALKNMSMMLKDKSSELILSTLCGRPEILFNSHRIFDLEDLQNEFTSNGLMIKSLAINNIAKQWQFEDWSENHKAIISKSDYNLVVFILQKLENNEI